MTCGRQSGKEGLCHHGPWAKFVSPAGSLYATATRREHGVRTASRSARSQASADGVSRLSGSDDWGLNSELNETQGF